jgi:hypothetical protein
MSPFAKVSVKDSFSQHAWNLETYDAMYWLPTLWEQKAFALAGTWYIFA